MRCFILCFALLFCAVGAHAQSFGIASLFKPGARTSFTYLPDAAISDSQSVGFAQLGATAIVPLKGSFSIDIKKLKAEANQAFWTLGGAVREVRVTDAETRFVYTFGTGVTGVRAGTGKGIWAYSANIGLIQDPGVRNTYQPFAAGGLLRIRIKGVHRQNFFGVGAAWNGRSFIPVPIWGIRRRIASNMHLSLLLPLQADITWKPAKKFELNLWNRLASFRSSFRFVPEGGAAENRMINYNSLQSSIVAQYKFSGRFKLLAEGGYSYLRSFGFETTGKDDIASYNPEAVPFARISARFNFGSSPLAAELFGNDL